VFFHKIKLAPPEQGISVCFVSDGNLPGKREAHIFRLVLGNGAKINNLIQFAKKRGFYFSIYYQKVINVSIDVRLEEEKLTLIACNFML